MLVLSFHGQSCFLHRRKGKAPLRKPWEENSIVKEWGQTLPQTRSTGQ